MLHNQADSSFVALYYPKYSTVCWQVSIKLQAATHAYMQLTAILVSGMSIPAVNKTLEAVPMALCHRELTLCPQTK